MPYNKLNKLLYYKDVLTLAQKHYTPNISTYSGVYREYVYPVYKMEYKTFMNIINYRNLDADIKAEMDKQG